MMNSYQIDDQEFSVSLQDAKDFTGGENTVLADKFDDITRAKPWFDTGYSLIDSGEYFDHEKVKVAVHMALEKIIAEEFPEIDLNGFTLERYHEYVDDEQHLVVISKSRRLYPGDLAFDTETLTLGLGEYFNQTLSYINPLSHTEQWIIVRINRPNSVGFNPAHKDIYEIYDAYQKVPKMVNIWIPVCGVSGNTGLPVAPKSHLLPEKDIIRTRAGSSLNGQSYSVNSILSWGGQACMTTLVPKPNEMVVFSSHLVHGIAVNNHANTTRISLEFRLFVA